jgi:hypothetical protein
VPSAQGWQEMLAEKQGKKDNQSQDDSPHS